MSTLSSQQIFDAALQQATHLTRSTGINGRDCKYRDSQGNQCFIGALIPQGKYLPEFEGKKGGVILERLGLITSKDAFFIPCEEQIVLTKGGLVEELQALHDNYEPSDWFNRFLRIARQYTLTCNPDHLKALEAVSI